MGVEARWSVIDVTSTLTHETADETAVLTSCFQDYPITCRLLQEERMSATSCLRKLAPLSSSESIFPSNNANGTVYVPTEFLAFLRQQCAFPLFFSCVICFNVSVYL